MRPAAGSRGHPLEALWNRAWVVSVASMGVALAAILSLARRDGDRLETFVFALLLIEWIAAGTLVTIYLVRDWAARLEPPRLASFAVLILLCNTWLLGTIAWALSRSLTESNETWAGFIARLTAIALCTSLPTLAAFRNYWRIHQLSVEKQRAHIAALHARIRPHFLFNTLNTAVALVRARPDAAETVLLDLSDLFRAALDAPRDVPLAHELAMVRRYLEIEKMRLGDRLVLQWDVPSPPPSAVVPSLSIQPLAENAVRHGIERSTAGGVVRLAVETAADHVVLLLSNPVPADAAATPGHSVGLASARERIVASGHGSARVEATQVDGQFVVRIELPLLTAQVVTR